MDKINILLRNNFEEFIDALKTGDVESVRQHYRDEWINEEDTTDEYKRRPIHFACVSGHVDVVKFLLNKDCELESTDKGGWRPIHMACFNGHTSVVTLLLDYECQVEAALEDGRRPIHIACNKGHEAVVQNLLERSCDMEQPVNPFGWRPIHFACNKGYANIVQMLLLKGCDFEASADKNQWRPVHFACDRGHTEIVEMLLSKGCEVEAPTEPDRWRAIHFACNKGHTDVAKLLLDRRCQMEEETTDGFRPIHCACRSGHAEMVKILLERGCEIEAATKNGRRPIHWACANGHAEMVKNLLERGCEIEAADENGRRPIHWACANGHSEIVKFLLESGCEIEAATKNGWSHLHLSCEKGYLSVAQCLLDNGCQKEGADRDGWRPIHFACNKGYDAIVELLLRKGCVIEEATNGGWLPIHFACDNGHVAVVKLLLDRQCQKELETKDGLRPIHYACNKGHNDIVQLLLENGCALEAPDRLEGWRPIHFACKKGHDAVVEMLLRKGCSMEEMTNFGWRPIHLACQNGHVAVAQRLLDNGCMLEAAENNGWRPIHFACKKGHADIVRMLLDAGSVIDAQTEKGRRPLDLAKWFNNHVCARIVENAQKSREKSEFQIFHFKSVSIVCRQFRIYDLSSAMRMIQRFVSPLKRPIVFCHFIIDKRHFPPHLTAVRLISERLIYQEHVIVDKPDDHEAVKAMATELRDWDIEFVGTSEYEIKLNIKSIGASRWMDRLLVSFDACEEGSTRTEETVHMVLAGTTAVVDMKNTFIDFMKLLYWTKIRATSNNELLVDLPETLYADESSAAFSSRGDDNNLICLLVKLLTMRNRLLTFYDRRQQKLSGTTLLKDADLAVQITDSGLWRPNGERQRRVFVQQKRRQRIKLIHTTSEVIDAFVFQESLLLKSVTDDKPSIVLLRKDYQNARDIRQKISDEIGNVGRVILISDTELIADNANVDDSVNYAIVERCEDAKLKRVEGGFLGKGSFGQVSKYKSTDNETIFAMKEIMLKSNCKEQEEIQKDVKAEILVAARVCGHERIVRYRGFYENTSDWTPMFHILMDCMKESLSKHVKRNHSLPEGKITRLSKEILQGLKYLHDHKIINRDLKGDNVLLDENESVKLADFGISKCLNINTDEAENAGAQTEACTLNYMAPEIIVAQTGKSSYGTKSDVWSFGATMVEMVTGRPPFAGMSPGQISTALGNSPKIPYEFPTDFSSGLNCFMNLCLTADPQDRPNCATLLANDIFRT